MCGITGFWAQKTINGDPEQIIRAMNACIAHRGPDSDGIWIDTEAGLAFGHLRLAIVDLSPQGSQPMFSDSERYVIIFNGEIYNFQHLREELIANGEAPQFRGTSDTEVMLACFEAWGIEATLKKLTGMYAIAIWDQKEKTLHLTRDRMGEKPLYYGWVDGCLLFASDLLAFGQFPAFNPRINREALTLLMRHGYIPAPYTIYEDVHKLPPATYITFRPDQPNARPQPVAYWSPKEAAEGWQDGMFEGSEEEAIDELERRLSAAIRDQMIADVPLGAFLSGGVDSSTIVALMQAQSTQPIRTFSIGFHEAEYDEAPHAKAVAQHLGTDHTETYLSMRDALDVIPLLGNMYSEPFADPSQIPTYLVSKVARQHVTVSLSGDAGDELFVGYNRYFRTARAYEKIKKVPQWMQSVGAQTLQNVPEPVWDALSSVMPAETTTQGRPPRIQKLQKWADQLPIRNMQELYHLQFIHPDAVVLNATVPETAFTQQDRWAKVVDDYHHMTYLDLIAYLPDDILVKVDRASMWVALEARVPLLNHKIVEFSYQVPTSMKVRDGQGKWILRQLLYRYVPRELIERPKQGFGVPIEHWLRDELRDWAEALLDKSRLQQEGYFDADLIRQKWEAHLAGTQNNHYFLWNVLMFQQWHETHMQ